MEVKQVENLNTNKLNIFTNFKDVVNIKDLQKMLGIGRNLAYKLISQNRIGHFKINNRIFIPKQNVIDFLFESEVQK